LRVVCNSSIVIGLSAIGQLDLLPKRFPEGIVLPSAVWREVVQEGGGRVGAKEVAAAEWITVQAVSQQALVRTLQRILDDGEAEAIALAHEIEADVVLLDERDARREAVRLGLPVLGTIGILVWAKRSQLLSSLKDALDALRTKAGFRVGPSLYDRVLRVVGET
jgi:predicted nucleic acid-binding protein